MFHPAPGCTSVTRPRWTLRGLLGRKRVMSTLGLAIAVGSSQVVMGMTGVLTARWLGPEGKGLVAGANAWAQALGGLGGLGVAAAVQVRVARALEKDRGAAVRGALGNSLAYALVAGASLTAVAFVPLQRALEDLGQDSFATVAFALIPLPLSMLAFALALLQLGLGRTARYAASTVAGPATTLIFALAVHLSVGLRPATLTACYIPGYLVSLAVSAGKLPWREARVHVPYFRADLRLGIRMWIPGALSLANFRLDLLVMATFLGARDVGLYSTANNVMLPVVALPVAIAHLAAVSTSRADVSAGRTVSVASLQRGATLALAAAAATGAAVAIAAPIVLPRLLGSAYDGVVPLVWLLLVGYTGRAVSWVIAAGANGLELPAVGMRSEGAGLVVTLVLLPFLLPTLGATGAAITSTAAYLTSAVVATCWLLRHQNSHQSSRPKNIG